ncbi:MAG: plasmid pRiA4b ORF-3 family protein [Calditrichaeota bacterium]|nr:plasmid pRiA4b ORF-3 family protein [Calditrichota bacterium]
MKIYHLKVSIIGIPGTYRIIEASENCTFDDIHEAIFHAFDRYDSHLYSFFITRKDTKSSQTIYQAPEVTHPQNVEDFMGVGTKKKSTAKTQLRDVGLHEKDVIHYLFDFGDEWWHRILVQSIKETEDNKKIVRIINSVGKSPPQYPDYDDYE